MMTAPIEPQRMPHLLRAGVVRLPVLPDADGNPQPNPADPIYNDTPVSRRVDFHSFRRAYNRALARAGVNVQQAMVLAAHSDAATHMGYVRDVDAQAHVPVGALPSFSQASVNAIMLRSPAGDSSRRRIANHSANTSGVVTRLDDQNALPCANLSASLAASGAVGQRFESSVARRELPAFHATTPKTMTTP
jgi:hypothetical protein